MLDIIISISLMIQIVLFGWLFVCGGKIGRHGLLMPLLMLADGYLLVNPYITNVIEYAKGIL